MTAPAPAPAHPPTALQAALARAARAAPGKAPPVEATVPAPAPSAPRSTRRAGLADKKAAAKAAMRPLRHAPAAPTESPAPPRRRAPPAPRRAGERITQLQDLATVARRLREEQERREAEDKAQREAAARAEAERHLFSRSVGPVTPLRNPNLARVRRHQPPPLPVQHWLDEERVLMESISDDFDVSTLLDTDDQLSFRRPGIGVEITRRLRAGHWSIQRQLDLHGLRVDEAREALGDFIRHAHKTGLRCVRVVHGKGLGSPGKSPVLKSRVQRWLVQKNEVLAFVQARPMDGGAGALVVLLQPVLHRHS
ncbi:hypothetical protein ACINB_44050 [Acidovorax sp. NB1]|nr:hypothetical protein ACINB_44050 [Acidovorax sp. NB1]